MKTRNGFVSNSSSSSFIIGLDEKPKHAGKIKVLFLGDRDSVPNEHFYPDWADDKTVPSFSVADIANVIFRDLKDAKPLTEEQIIEEINNGWFDESLQELNDYNTEKDKSWLYEKEYKERTGKDVREDTKSKAYAEWDRLLRKKWDEREKKHRQMAENFWNKRKKDFEGKQVFLLSYSDNDGDLYATIEHGGILDSNLKIPCIVVSHH